MSSGDRSRRGSGCAGGGGCCAGGGGDWSMLGGSGVDGCDSVCCSGGEGDGKRGDGRGRGDGCGRGDGGDGECHSARDSSELTTELVGAALGAMTALPLVSTMYRHSVIASHPRTWERCGSGRETSS